MNNAQKIFQTCLILTLILGMLAPAVLPGEPQAVRMSDSVAQLIAEDPGAKIRVIVQVTTGASLAEQYVEQMGGSVLKTLPLINAFVAEISAQFLPRLAALSSVSWISPDARIVSTVKPVKDPLSLDEMLPEHNFLDTLGVREVWDMGYLGEGIGVAVIDSGIFMDRDFSIIPNKPHIRIKMSQSFNSESPSDDFGHGTHVAGIIGGNGSASGGHYSGLAPRVDLINLKISDDQGFAYESDTVEAMQWVFDNKDLYNIRVVNLSIQSTIPLSYHESPLDAAAEILWFNGVVVVAAAGNRNDGEDFNPIQAAPGNDPFIITVGAVDENGTSKRDDDTVTSFTPTGMTIDGFNKPDIYAPGVDIISVLSNGSDWFFDHPERVVMDGEYFRLSGTSMAAPMVAGAAALLLQAEPDLTPDQVKYRLINSAGIVGSSPYLDVEAALTSQTNESGNQGIVPHMLLAKMAMVAFWSSQYGDQDIDWGAVDWNAGQLERGQLERGQLECSQLERGQLECSQLECSQLECSQLECSQLECSQLECCQLECSQLECCQLERSQLEHGRLECSIMGSGGK